MPSRQLLAFEVFLPLRACGLEFERGGADAREIEIPEAALREFDDSGEREENLESLG